jgi:Cupredoxin-like domain
MRTLMLSVAAAAGLAVSGLLALPGRADDHSAHRPKGKEDQRRLDTYSKRPAQSADLEVLPSTETYRSSYFFPKDPPARPKPDQVRDVTLYDNYFSPSNLMIPSGMTVRFTNDGEHHHTTTCNWLWESGELRPRKSFSITFTRTGTYSYHCRHHRAMSGVIVVY